MAAGLPVVFVLLFCVMVLSSPCLGNPLMGPGMEHDIRSMVYGNSATYPLPPEWEIQDFSFADRDITVTLESKGEKAVVRLSYPWLPVRGDVVGRTLSFRLEIMSVDSEAARRAALDFCVRIRENDRVYFFSSGNMKRRELWSQYLFRRYVFSPLIDHRFMFVVVAALALFLLILKSSSIKEYLLPKNVWGIFVLALIVVTGLGLRYFVSPATPIHCNNHGIREVRMHLSLHDDLKNESDYGRVFPATARWILGFMGAEEKNVFLMNNIFGALVILSLFMFVKGFTGSDTAGLFSALFMCLSPAQVWLAGTESQIPMFLFVGLFGLGLLCMSVRTGNILSLWLAAILISFSSSLRILTVLIIPVSIAVWMLLAGRAEKENRRTFNRHLIACLAVALVWAYFHYLSMSGMTGKGWSETGPLHVLGLFLFRDGLSFRNTILDPTLTPFIVPAAAALSYVFSWKHDKRLAVFMTVVFLVVVPMTFSVLDCRSTAVRYQAQAHWVYFFMAAVMFSSSCPGFLRRKRAIAGAVIAVLTVAGAIPGLMMLHRGDEEMNEYRFIRETASEIPGGSVIRLPVSDAAGGRLITDYPDYINSHIVVKNGDESPPGRKELTYIGLDCYRYDTEQEREEEMLADGRNRQCIEECDGRLAPRYETKLNAGHPRIGYHDRFFPLSIKEPLIGYYECIADEK